MNRRYRWAQLEVWKNNIDLETGSFIAIAVMTQTTANNDLSARTLTGVGTGFTALDEYNGSGYSRATVSGIALAEDATNDLCQWKCNALNFGAAVQNGTRSMAGVVIAFDTGGSDATRVPVFFIDTCDSGPTFPHAPAGNPVVMSWTNSVVVVG